MARRWFEPAHSFSDENLKKEWRHIQLILDMDVELPNGNLIPLKILVDTGAQVNLIRRDLVSRQHWRGAENPVKLVTANNTILDGGDEVVQLGLYFNVVEDGFVQPRPIFFEGEFYGAEIEVDAILSYPWLRQNSVGVFPHRDALARDWPFFGLLYGWKEKEVVRPNTKFDKKSNQKRVRPVMAIHVGGGAPPLKFGHEPARWVACEYAVRSEVVEQIALHFGQKPERDAFADARNARFERWYGPGSIDGEDAFEKKWGKELLWINPPFDLFNKVHDKIQSDKAHAILIVPR